MDLEWISLKEPDLVAVELNDMYIIGDIEGIGGIFQIMKNMMSLSSNIIMSSNR